MGLGALGQALSPFSFALDKLRVSCEGYEVRRGTAGGRKCLWHKALRAKSLATRPRHEEGGPTPHPPPQEEGAKAQGDSTT